MIAPIEVKSLSDFVEQVNATGSIFHGVELPFLFWRGQLASQNLLPSALRGPETPEQNSQRETRRLLRFQAVAAARGSVPPMDNHLEWLVLMQHSGLPTRLLDWSASPLVAMFFAVEERKNPDEKSGDAAVWMMNPMRLNQATGQAVNQKKGRMRLHSFKSQTLQSAAKKAFNPKDRLEGSVYAMAAYHNDAQQMVQHSCFTIHGNVDPLENHGEADQFLAKLVIPSGNKQEIRMALARLGIRRDLLFPDFANLAREIKESDNLFPAKRVSDSLFPKGRE